jgi:hypothetical protein
MVQLIGFDEQQDSLITSLIGRFDSGGFKTDELVRIEKTDEAGYDGKVIPTALDDGGLEMTMSLTNCNPFTIAHELAHVSDIAVRRHDSLTNLRCDQPSAWHLAYKMSSEYYANRTACDYAGQDDIFRAFRSDAAGMLVSAAAKDWGSFLVYYALALGILHGVGRMDVEPIRMLTPKAPLPVRVVKGLTGFKRQSVVFFDGYGG